MSTNLSSIILQRQYKDILNNPVSGCYVGINEENLYKWDVVLIGPPNTLYADGIFKARITFPHSYPNNPPKFRFISHIFHPNIYKNGIVCISILHPPGEDEFGYENSEERWRPIHNVQSIILSIIILLSNPNIESPANIDAANMWKSNKTDYKKKIKECVKLSQKN